MCHFFTGLSIFLFLISSFCAVFLSKANQYHSVSIEICCGVASDQFRSSWGAHQVQQRVISTSQQVFSRGKV